MLKIRKEQTGMLPGSRGKKKKKWKIAAGILAAALLLCAAAGVFSGGDKEQLPTVDAAEVAKGDITSTLETSGVIASEVTRVYASAVNAKIGEVPVVLGQGVEKGDYLLTYDTDSLQKSYDIAELQAKAENAAGSDTLAKASESAGDLAVSESEMHTLQGQIDTVNAEINALQAQAVENEMASNNRAAANEELARLEAEIETLGAQIAKLEESGSQGVLSEKEKETLGKLKKEKKEKEHEAAKKKKSLKGAGELANRQTQIQAQISQKNNELSELQGKFSEAQSKNASAEAGILTEAARANISYSQQANKLTLEQTAEDLSKAKAGITADFDGIVTEVAAAAGTMAAEGTSMITLASAEHMCVEVPVSKYNLVNLKPGQSAVITFQDNTYQGNISYISKLAEKGESGAAMVMMKVHIDTPDNKLILGLDAKVTVDLGTAQDACIVPVSAVNSDTQGDFVYTIENGTVVKKYVTTGMSSTDEIEIKSGVEPGEKVITNVDSDIIEGMEVQESEQQNPDEAPTTELTE